MINSRGDLLWIDLEMSGLDSQNDVILEIASIITDKELMIIKEGPSLVIHQNDNILLSMNSWCKKQHGLSGLTDAVKQSTISLAQAEQATIDFIKQYGSQTPMVLCGNTIWQDRLFLMRYMPSLMNLIHYRMIDVSSFKELIKYWFASTPYSEFIKKDSHRALTDIKESIEELRHYRTYFFKEQQ